MALQFTPGTTKPTPFPYEAVARQYASIADAHYQRYASIGKGISAGAQAYASIRNKKQAEQKKIEANQLLSQIGFDVNKSIQYRKGTRGELLGGRYASYVDDTPLELEAAQAGGSLEGIPFSEEALKTMSKAEMNLGRFRFERRMDEEGIMGRSERDRRYNYLTTSVEMPYVPENVINAAKANWTNAGLPPERLDSYLTQTMGSTSVDAIGKHGISGDLKEEYAKEFPMPEAHEPHAWSVLTAHTRPELYEAHVRDLLGNTYGRAYDPQYLDQITPGVAQALRDSGSHDEFKNFLSGLLTRPTVTRSIPARQPAQPGASARMRSSDVFGGSDKAINLDNVKDLSAGELNTLRGFTDSLELDPLLNFTVGEGGKVRVTSDQPIADDILDMFQRAVDEAGVHNKAFQEMFYGEYAGAPFGASGRTRVTQGGPMYGAGQGSPYGGMEPQFNLEGWQQGVPQPTRTQDSRQPFTPNAAASTTFEQGGSGLGVMGQPTVVPTGVPPEVVEAPDVDADVAAGQKLIDLEFESANLDPEEERDTPKSKRASSRRVSDYEHVGEDELPPLVEAASNLRWPERGIVGVGGRVLADAAQVLPLAVWEGGKGIVEGYRRLPRVAEYLGVKHKPKLDQQTTDVLASGEASIEAGNFTPVEIDGKWEMASTEDGGTKSLGMGRFDTAEQARADFREKRHWRPRRDTLAGLTTEAEEFLQGLGIEAGGFFDIMHDADVRSAREAIGLSDWDDRQERAYGPLPRVRKKKYDEAKAKPGEVIKSARDVRQELATAKRNLDGAKRNLDGVRRLIERSEGLPITAPGKGMQSELRDAERAYKAAQSRATKAEKAYSELYGGDPDRKVDLDYVAPRPAAPDIPASRMQPDAYPMSPGRTAALPGDVERVSSVLIDLKAAHSKLDAKIKKQRRERKRVSKSDRDRLQRLAGQIELYQNQLR